jgi:gamma-glutamylputrescine oxidase
MNNKVPPYGQVAWYVNQEPVAPCRENMSADIVVVGGGIAGLTAAQEFRKRGKKVVLLEQYYCGSGASGKSSGFVTPNAELSFTDFSKKYNPEAARTIWDSIEGGVAHIRNNIEKYGIECGYSPQDTLVLATSKKALATLEQECENLVAHGYKASMYSQAELSGHIGGNSGPSASSQNYYGGFEYRDTFNMNSYQYCQGLKEQLIKDGVLIFEETPVLKIEKHAVKTAHATITADYIIVCADRFMPQLKRLEQDVYHVQTFIMLSQQLTPAQIAALFPKGPRLCWDTELIYNYFCVNAHNRLLIGGGSLLNTYDATARYDSSYMVRKLTRTFERYFPDFALQSNVLKNNGLQFEYMWPGLIGISKDIMPISGPDAQDPSIYYVGACAGLPIAAALGRYSAEYYLDGRQDLQDYFSPYRSFPIGGLAQSVMGTKLAFAFSHLIKTNIP